MLKNSHLYSVVITHKDNTFLLDIAELWLILFLFILPTLLQLRYKYFVIFMMLFGKISADLDCVCEDVVEIGVKR